jgi:hypothetical protein
MFQRHCHLNEPTVKIATPPGRAIPGILPNLMRLKKLAGVEITHTPLIDAVFLIQRNIVFTTAHRSSHKKQTHGQPREPVDFVLMF